MMDHGALDINSGRKIRLGPDRHHQHKKEERDRSLETARERADKQTEAVKAQQAKVAESESKGHGKRLEQRPRRLATWEQELKAVTAHHAQCFEHVAAWGPAGPRAERDVRKQTLMTIRTLLWENMLRAFMAVRLATLPTKVSLPRVWSLLLERCGSRLETPSQGIYRVHTTGLFRVNRRLLREIVEGLCAMGLQEQGKPIHVRLKDMPP
jgi:hypothetical protein